MKRIKWLAFALCIVVLLSLYLYQNFIYYMIPFNPFKEYTSESPVGFRIEKDISNGESVIAHSNDSKNLGLVLEYLSNLKLIPLKDNDKLTLPTKKGNGTNISGMLVFDESREIFINDLYTDNPTVLYISSFIPGFKGKGYYKIVGSKFDYNYIYSLIGDTKE